MDEPSTSRTVLEVQGLTVLLPDGTPVVRNIDVVLRAGEVVTLLGPSGAGKTTLLRALVAPNTLRAQGYSVTWTSHRLLAQPAFVPQRGALLDHLDVRENIALARAAVRAPNNADQWLEAVGLDARLATRMTSQLSGGQAQRVAVARTLAAERELLILDEPSVGLDPLAVKRLARFLLQQARTHHVAVLVITHDLTLASGASDRFLFLDPHATLLRGLHETWSGPLEPPQIDQAEVDSDNVDDRSTKHAALERAVHEALHGVPSHRSESSEASASAWVRAKRWLRARTGHSPSSVSVAGMGLWRTFHPRMFLPSMRVLRVVTVQALLRPLLFYCVVGVLLGFTIPYVIANISADLKPDRALRLVGGTYVLALAPPVSSILFAATSAGATSAWLGGLFLNKQTQALEGLGVETERYLLAPTWSALVMAHVMVTGVFTTSMMLGGKLLFGQYHVPDAWKILSADFLDPAPTRLPYLVRGIWLVAVYALSIASIAVAQSARPKERTDDVTASMTRSVVRATLWVVFAELISVVALFAWTHKSS